MLDACLKHGVAPLTRRRGQTRSIAVATDDAGLAPQLRTLLHSQVDFTVVAKSTVLRLIESRFRDRLLDAATFSLERHEPQFSARPVLITNQRNAIVLIAVAMSLVIALSPATGAVLAIVFVAVCYLANAAFRSWLFWVGSFHSSATGSTDTKCEAPLPVYTILVPLYREANVLPQLVRGLRALDYPASLLDVKLIVEEDDITTLNAAHSANADCQFDVLHVPVGKPRTKPRACNYALQFARGEFLAIYDAEDQPEPDQLKKAVRAFREAPPSVACLQARLNFFNARENWITRLFALDYALWFDFLLPGLDRLQIPMPLGGTSNHFRVEALRAIHGWDPFNVTEDADIGIRLARLGYRVQTLDSTTFEEATNALGNWLRQRTRWMKGYMQTWLVHMRAPLALLRNAGPSGFAGFQFFVGGTVLSALLNPLLWLIFVLSFFVELPGLGLSGTTRAISGSGLLLGNGLFAYLAMLGPYRRGWLELSPFGLLVPIYWLLISVAAYRALWQLMCNPWYWEKTPHGLTRIASSGGTA